MFKGIVCVVAGLAGLIAVTSSAFSAYGPCAGGLQYLCWCSYDAGEDYYYYCEDYRRLTYICYSENQTSCDNTDKKCYANLHTNRVKCAVCGFWGCTPSVGCVEGCEVISASCAIKDPDCFN
jgi:hypothetical protein